MICAAWRTCGSRRCTFELNKFDFIESEREKKGQFSMKQVAATTCVGSSCMCSRSCKLIFKYLAICRGFPLGCIGNVNDIQGLDPAAANNLYDLIDDVHLRNFAHLNVSRDHRK